MTVSTLRPDGTTSAGSASFTGGATWQAVTSDDSDASYATMSAGLIAVLTSGTVSLPAGAVTKQVRTRMRIRADSATSTAAFRVQSGGLDVAGVVASPTTAIVTYTGNYYPTTWTQTQIDGLVLQVANEHASVACRYLELYVDLMYATVPTVVVNAPTGTTTLSLPTATWTYTQGSDGGPQSRYWWKVFDSATYGGGGFDPETSTPLFNSGEVVSNATEAKIGPFATDGTNHRVYMKVAQTINGVAHWSAWASSTFTVDVTTPLVSSVVPTAGTGNISVVVNRNTGAAAWTMVTVERSVDSGTTWTFVRGATRAAASGNTFTIVDYEAPHSTNVLYRGQALDATTYSPFVNAGSQLQWTSTSAWLKSINSVTLNKAVTLKEAFAYEVEVRSGVFQVLGRNAPVVISDTASTRRGQLMFQTITRAQADELKALLRIGGVLLLQSPDAWDIAEGWFVVQGYGRTHLAPEASRTAQRVWSVNVVEVDRPPDTSS